LLSRSGGRIRNGSRAERPGPNCHRLICDLRTHHKKIDDARSTVGSCLVDPVVVPLPCPRFQPTNLRGASSTKFLSFRTTIRFIGGRLPAASGAKTPPPQLSGLSPSAKVFPAPPIAGRVWVLRFVFPDSSVRQFSFEIGCPAPGSAFYPSVKSQETQFSCQEQRSADSSGPFPRLDFLLHPSPKKKRRTAPRGGLCSAWYDTHSIKSRGRFALALPAVDYVNQCCVAFPHAAPWGRAGSGKTPRTCSNPFPGITSAL